MGRKTNKEILDHITKVSEMINDKTRRDASTNIIINTKIAEKIAEELKLRDRKRKIDKILKRKRK